MGKKASPMGKNVCPYELECHSCVSLNDASLAVNSLPGQAFEQAKQIYHKVLVACDCLQEGNIDTIADCCACVEAQKQGVKLAAVTCSLTEFETFDPDHQAVSIDDKHLSFAGVRK